MAKIKAALLDENGIYLRIDELEGPKQLTPRHLPKITECDLPPGRYYWAPAKRDILNNPNPLGGAFWPLDSEPLTAADAPKVAKALDKAFQEFEEKYW